MPYLRFHSLQVEESGCFILLLSGHCEPDSALDLGRLEMQDSICVLKELTAWLS